MAGREEELPRDLLNLYEGNAVDFIVATERSGFSSRDSLLCESRRFWLGAGCKPFLAPMPALDRGRRYGFKADPGRKGALWEDLTGLPRPETLFSRSIASGQWPL